MKIEAGKRYIRRDGKISGVIIALPTSGELYEFKCPEYDITYTKDGHFWASGKEHCRDLIREYTEPVKLGYDLQKERRDFWVQCFIVPDLPQHTERSAMAADKCLAEFDKRFNQTQP